MATGAGKGDSFPRGARKKGRTEEFAEADSCPSTNFIALPAEEIDEGIRDVLGAVGKLRVCRQVLCVPV
jgi:hypothetical protein